MKQKVICCNKIGKSDIKMEWYGIKPLRSQTQVEELPPFENELTALVRNSAGSSRKITWLKKGVYYYYNYYHYITIIIFVIFTNIAIIIINTIVFNLLVLV